uniref:VPS35 endosomal protein-sorting factor-like n=1 Tax=Phallusia mammillata TaxID=59560 RepID=A0A6F9D7C7_9ASCI|nr:UPF0505 protein C16orf62-like [Phallusia mammillata]
MSSETIWKPKKFNYELLMQTRKPLSPLKSTDFHPLKPITVTDSIGVKVSHVASKNEKSVQKTSKNNEIKEDFVDPLTAMSIDPLSAIVMETKNEPKKVEKTEEDSVSLEYDDEYEPWSSRKLAILQKYTTNDRLSVTMTSMSKGESRQGMGRQNQSSSISDKLKDRLGQLDDFEEGGMIEMQNLSQQEFIEKMHQLNETLIQSWNSNQKVKALKIAIQCSKLLGDLSVIQFYPSKFVLVTDLLDTFGGLVFDRILSLCNGMTADSIVPEEVPDTAREICVNWLLKIASIRELLPRIFVEASIIHCNDFLQIGETKSVLNRLTNMTCGIGDPLIAVYVRAYLCRMGVRYAPKFKGHLKTNFYDFLVTYKQIHTHPVQNKMAAQKLDMAVYLDHYIPAVEWILSSLAHKAREATMSEVLEKCRKGGNSLMLLNCCISAFNADYVSSRALALCDLINQQKDDIFPKDRVFQTLAKKVIKSDPPEDDRLPLLNDVWKLLMKIHHPKRYIACAEAWSEFAAKNFTKKEVSTILGDIIKHMLPDRAFEQHYSQLTSVVSNVLQNMKNFSDIFSMDKFLPFLDMFHNETKKVEVCKLVASAFNSIPDSTTSDPIVINGLMYICKVMHDSINALSLDDDKKAASDLISGFILKVTFGKDFEQQLSFFVECRASFYGLDSVLATLVHAVNRLSSQVNKIVKGNHTRKTSAFVRACTAYTFITIPSLQDKQLRLLLYMESGQVALTSQCITQSDAIYKSSISLIMDILTVPDKKGGMSHQNLVGFLSTFLSSLLLVPDNPDQGVLYLLRGFLNVISNTEVNLSMYTQCTIYLKILSMLTAYSQNQYIYHITKVDSNDNLYNSDPKFLEEINTLSCTILDQVLGYLSSPRLSPDKQEQKNQSICATNLFEVIIAHSDLKDDKMQRLAAVVWELANRNGFVETKGMVRILDDLKNKGGEYLRLANSLPLQSRA